jgi:DNA-binding NarL/FixJ family response regulator
MDSTVKSFKIVVADDDPLVRAAVKAIIVDIPYLSLCAEAENGAQAVKAVRDHQPDLLLLDLNMPEMPGIDALRELSEALGKLRVIILTVHADKRTIVSAIQYGARGLVLKTDAARQLQPAIEAVLKKKFWFNGGSMPDVQPVVAKLTAEMPRHSPKRDLLNERELNVLRYVVLGATNKDIAREMKTSEQVVKNLVSRIFDKLGVFNRLELALYAMDNDIVPRP